MGSVYFWILISIFAVVNLVFSYQLGLRFSGMYGPARLATGSALGWIISVFFLIAGLVRGPFSELERSFLLAVTYIPGFFWGWWQADHRELPGGLPMNPQLLKRIFWASRPVVSIFGALLCWGSFNLQFGSMSSATRLGGILVSISIFCWLSMTMLFNDYYDRKVDQLKGKDLAAKYSNQMIHVGAGGFLLVSLIAWILFDYSILKMGSLYEHFVYLGGMYISLVVSVTYYRSYRFSFFSMIITAVFSALPCLYPVVMKHAEHRLSGILFYMAMILALMAREIIKDCQDIDLDRERKMTVPVIYGVKKAQYIAGALLGMVALILPIIHMQGIIRPVGELTVWLGGVGIYCTVDRNGNYSRLKGLIDIATVIMLSEILVGWLRF